MEGNVIQCSRELVQKTHQHRLSFLLLRKHLAQVVLGLFQIGLFGLLRRAIFVERGFYLRRRSVLINGLLQRISFCIAGAAGRSAVVATLATAASEPSEHPLHRITASIEYLLHQWLYRAPLRIVCKTEVGLGPIHKSLFHLGWIEISATAAAAAATTATRLRLNFIRAHTQSRGHR